MAQGVRVEQRFSTARFFCRYLAGWHHGSPSRRTLGSRKSDERAGLVSMTSKTLEVECFNNYAIMTFSRSSIKITLVYVF